MLNVEFSTTGFVNPAFSASRHATQNVDMFTRLASLSLQKQWILYTGECPRPQYGELTAHNVHCSKIIHMKSSQSQSEITIVMKAIQSGNASAIVASGNIDIVSQKLLQKMATEHNCEVFFLDSPSQRFH